MNRLHKKCAIASTGLHLLLVLVLFVGPGFLAPKNQPVDMPLLDFVPFETVDDAMSGGGDPNARPVVAPPNTRPQIPESTPPPTPPTPAPEPEPPREQKTPDPEPQVKPEPKRTEAAMEPTPKKKLELKRVVRNPNKTADTEAKKQADAQAKQYSEYKKKLAGAIGNAVSDIPSSISGGTKVGLVGPGGGGVPYANFLQAVKTVYTRAWELPEGVTDDSATVETTVTIARDGTVVSWKVVRRSGNSVVDESVHATLRRVTYAAPLPRTASEDQRTVTINFNVRAKRMAG